MAEEYERGRPGYPPAAIEWLLGQAPCDVVDMGAGTGKLTAALVAAGHRVTAVEPLPEMRAILSERVPQAQVVDATAEESGLPTASADAVVAGSAFHWFDRARVMPEITRILRPAGTLGLLGNSFETSVPWARRLREILGGIRLGRPGHWPSEEEFLTWFEETDERRFRFEHTLDRGQLLDLALSRSSIAMLDPAERQAALDQVSALWAQEPELQGQSSVTLRYVTHARRARRVNPDRRLNPADRQDQTPNPKGPS